MSRRPRVALLKSRRLAVEVGHAYDGGSVHVVKQLQALAANGYEVDVFTRSESAAECSPIEVFPGIHVWCVRFVPSDSRDLFIRDFEEGRSFVDGVLGSPGFAAASFDAIQIHHWTSGVDIAESLPEAIPIVFTPHLLPTEKALANNLSLPNCVAKAERNLLARADTTIAMSLAEEESCRRLGGRRVEQIANGVSEAFFQLPLSQRPAVGGPVRLGSVGRVCAQKGTDILLDAVESLLVRGIDAYLDIVGPSYGEDEFESEIRKRILNPMLSGRVRMLGPVSHEALPLVVTKWDVYIQPSRYESQGIALLEAMASGRCVVSTSLSAVTEFVSERVGHLVPTPPVGDAVANAVSEALESSSWQARVQGARDAAKEFRWKVTSSNLLDCMITTIRKSDWQGAGKTTKLSQALYRQGRATARKIAGDNQNAGIFLLGSAARGVARPGSDVDLLVLQDNGQRSDQGWRFTQGVPVDVRWEATENIYRMCEMSDDEFVDKVVQHPLVDYLCGAVALKPVRQDLVDAIALLQRRRFSDKIRSLIANRMLARAETLFGEAASLACQNLPADAQLKINAGAQLLLQATLIRVGWVTHGAKRRLETAVSYARISAPVRRTASFLTTAVGIDGMTYAHARKLITARTQMRNEHFICLERLGVSSTEIDIAHRHAQGATDYYSPTISDGYLKGCINHIKSLSGVPLMPTLYTRLLNLDPGAPTHSFLTCSDISTEVRKLWLAVMEPHGPGILSEHAAIGLGLARELAERDQLN